ncbi:hypothetical protein [Streptomyces sp. NPDC088557]|uniref:hypothetical protein n=1 Tax=Streptomyces sp. NPDC088557 TaxID=3365867 RepID=UPI003807F3DC
MAWHPVPTAQDCDRAITYLGSIMRQAGQGNHNLMLSVPCDLGGGGTTYRGMAFVHPGDDGEFWIDDIAGGEFVELTGIAVQTSRAGLVLRTFGETSDRVMGWRFSSGIPTPLTVDEISLAYRIDTTTAPEQTGEETEYTEYAEGFTIQ